LKFISSTEKIPKGYGYILKPSSLVSALIAAEVNIEVNLTRSHSRKLFDAHFWIPNPNVPHERLYIVAGTAKASDLPEIRSKVMNEAIPELVQWISGILELDTKSPIRRQSQSIQLLPLRD
jgi:hypothetical protein